MVFGVHSPADSAHPVAERVRARFPDRDIALVADATVHGENGKVSNLINMMAAARHGVIVIADSDVHAAPDYLARLADALARPGAGLACTLYAGRAAHPGWVGRLGVLGITTCFLPGALLARAMGRQDCLGATMALRRETLEAIGGFPALADHLADDAVLGLKIRALGLDVRLAHTVPATTVPETRLSPLWRHELRWGRTIRQLEPAGFAASLLQYPLAWALLALLLTPSIPSLLLFAAAWAARAAIALAIDTTLGLARKALASPAAIWLLPLRDLISVAVVLASFLADRVEWRGQVMHARPAPPEGFEP